VLLGALGMAGFVAWQRAVPRGAFLPGLRVDGEALPEKATPERARALVRDRAEALRARRVRVVRAGDEHAVVERTLGELGVTVDVDATVDVAERLTDGKDLLTRVELARDAQEGKIDVPLRIVVERKAAWDALLAVKETEDSPPVSARLDLEKHATIAEKPGLYLDADATIARIAAVARDVVSAARARGAVDASGDAIVVEAPVATFAPRISSAFLKSLSIETVVAEYETFFGRGGDQQRRGKNIDNAAQKLDGLVISPGEMVSFNEVVGERSEANGFQKSWEIFKGEMVEGVGGGTCQVASTFHAATLFAGFDVLERLPHSRPSAYIPLGLDSTVVFPAVDLKVRNPHPFPVVVHAKTEGNKLKVELLGKERPVQVTFGRDVEKAIAYKRKIVEDPSLTGKKVRVKQHGIKGYKVKRSRVLVYANGTRKTETASDFYPPTTEIYQVPVGFDVALLPALPGGEGDGEDADLGGNPAPAPASARAPSSSSAAGATASAGGEPAPAAPDVEFVEAPGAHAPTSAQKAPPKSIVLRR
jgi:vancomycin resistance protein YoaR